MNTEEPSHSENGLLAILAKPWVYNLFSRLVGKKRTQKRIVSSYIRPFPGCRILEIGCGTASILTHMPDSIGEYTGFDMNPSYIEFAKQHWGARFNCRFFCQKVEEAARLEKDSYDIVIAWGIVHHLSDIEATYLFDIAYQSLKPNGALITYDNVYLKTQHWFAKWLISKDRGRAVRTSEEYLQLSSQFFADIESDVLHDTLKIPYTIFIMRCVKNT
jgi:2-polyprenyl-3-methyl-5-hydroxy-6-metoxy-1,4-benzoquinol methylase